MTATEKRTADAAKFRAKIDASVEDKSRDYESGFIAGVRFAIQLRREWEAEERGNDGDPAK